MIRTGWWFGSLIAGLAFIQELLFFKFLLFLSWSLRIERFHRQLLCRSELRQMTYEKHQLPAVVVSLFRAPCRHSRESDAIVNGVVKLPIGQILRLRQPHVGSFGIQVPSDLRIPAPVICVADGTVVGEMCSRLRHQLR